MADTRNGVAEFFSGLGAVVLFSSLYLFLRINIFLFVGVFAGVLPMIRGMSKMVQARVGKQEKQQIEGQTNQTHERIVLSLARSERGKITPAMVAVNSSLSLEDAEKQLQALVDKGYASLEVTDDGRLLYVFAEFLEPDSLPPPEM
jgi:hypothetical protein